MLTSEERWRVNEGLRGGVFDGDSTICLRCAGFRRFAGSLSYILLLGIFLRTYIYWIFSTFEYISHRLIQCILVPLTSQYPLQNSIVLTNLSGVCN